MAEIVQTRQLLFMKYRNQSNQTDCLANQEIFAIWQYNVQSIFICFYTYHNNKYIFSGLINIRCRSVRGMCGNLLGLRIRTWTLNLLICCQKIKKHQIWGSTCCSVCKLWLVSVGRKQMITFLSSNVQYDHTSSLT